MCTLSLCGCCSMDVRSLALLSTLSTPKQIVSKRPEPQTIPAYHQTHSDAYTSHAHKQSDHGGYCVFNLHSTSFANAMKQSTGSDDGEGGRGKGLHNGDRNNP